MEFTYNNGFFDFIWWGGSYITPGISYGALGFKPSDNHVIGVWDYNKDAPTIPKTQKAFERKCNEWFAENFN